VTVCANHACCFGFASNTLIDPLRKNDLLF
jgi:hypothetical protein